MKTRRHPKTVSLPFTIPAATQENPPYYELFRLKDMPYKIIFREITVFCNHDEAESLSYGVSGVHNSNTFHSITQDDVAKKFILGPFQGAYGPSGAVLNETYVDYEWVIWMKNTAFEEIPITLTLEIAYIEEKLN